jgi:hypothetical protein
MIFVSGFLAGEISMRQFLSAASAALLLASSSANSHIHTERDGSTVSWYPQDCCRDGDCRPVAKIWTAPHGLWMETVDGQTVLVGPKDKRQPSKDTRWHICLHFDADLQLLEIRCIFEPPNAVSRLHNGSWQEMSLPNRSTYAASAQGPSGRSPRCLSLDGSRTRGAFGAHFTWSKHYE